MVAPALFERILQERQRHKRAATQPWLLPPLAPPAPPSGHDAAQRALQNMLARCTQRGEDIIAWDESLEAEARCAPVDVLMRGSDRGHGMCEDAVQYAYYLGGRLVSPNLLDPNHTVVMHGQHVPYTQVRHVAC